jgi:hypothetical protein
MVYIKTRGKITPKRLRLQWSAAALDGLASYKLENGWLKLVERLVYNQKSAAWRKYLIFKESDALAIGNPTKGGRNYESTRNLLFNIWTYSSDG